jgi:hypothetical protein
MKEANSTEPAFNWWAQYTLKKRDAIISTVRAQIICRDYKFGIKVLAGIAEAQAFDKENGEELWERSVEKEMKNVWIAFKVLDDRTGVPVGYQQIPCMLIFDIKMDFTRKTCLVAGGHVTKPPSVLTYASVVTRESVRIALKVTVFSGLICQFLLTVPSQL